jgi:hypothetical protein
MAKAKEKKHPYLNRSPGWVSGLRPTSDQGTNPKDVFGTNKVPLALISPVATAIEAMCMSEGGYKYGPFNYRVSKVQAYVYLEAAKRHIDAVLDGQDYDSQTGMPHLGYARSTCGIYLDAWMNGHLIDNRPQPGKGPSILDGFARSPNQDYFTAEQNRLLFEKIRTGKV